MSVSFENIARNPVGRLHNILVSLPNDNRQKTVGQSLVEYFGVGESNTATQMELYADLAHLVISSNKALDELLPLGYDAVDIQEFRADVDRVAVVISTHNPQSLIRDFKAQFGAETLKGLQYCARILSKESPEPTLDAATLTDLLNQVQTLINEILGANLDAKLKAILLEHLSFVERALRLYAISGSQGLRRAADGLAGATLFGYAEHTAETERGWLQRCGKLAGWVATLTGFVANFRTAAPELPAWFEGLPKMLGGGS